MRVLLTEVRCGPEYNGSGAELVRALPIDAPPGAGAKWISVQLYDGYVFGNAIGHDGETIYLGGIHLDFAVLSDGESDGEIWKTVYDTVEYAGFDVTLMSWMS